MDNNLISNILQIESTNLIRGGTGNSYAPFELKLQLHGQVSNPYTVSVKQNYKVNSEIVVAFTSQSWTSPGTYTWVAPFTGTVTACVIGGGGGGCNESYNYSWTTAGSGNQSLFGSIVATGGGGGRCMRPDSESTQGRANGGSAGSPNGRTGGADTINGNASGGIGFALATTLTNGSYGKGGNARDAGYMNTAAGGGSGGCNITSVSVIQGTSYQVVVGSGGVGVGRTSSGSSRENGTSGAVGIWKE